MMRTRANDGLQSINAYYKMAMLMPVERLQNIVRGKDNAIPATIAMMALEAKMPQVAAAQGQQAAQQPPQPSVREQIGNQISTLPENVGVGALPAPNMEQMDAPGMADGGIVAFGHGGDVPGYADGVLVGQGLNKTPLFPVPTNSFNRRVKEQELAQQGDPLIYPALQETFLATEIARLEAALKTTPPGAQRTMLENNLAKLRNQAAPKPTASTATASTTNTAPVLEQYQAPPPEAKEPGWAVKGTKKGRRVVDKKGNVTFVPGELSRMPAPINEGDVYTGRDTYTPSQTSPFDLKTDAGKNANAKLTRGAGTNVKTGEKPGEKTDEKTDAKAGIATLQPSGESRSSELKSIIKDMRDASGVNDILVKQTAIEQLIDKQNKDEVARYKERPQYKPYEKYEKSLLSEEEKVKDKKNQNFQMALINAGLAIAGGSSRYALQNIGQGAMVGTKQYTEGLKDLEAAAKERQKAFAMIEEARNAKAEKDFDRYDSLMNKQSERMIASKQLGIEALSKVLNITVPKAADVYNNMKNITSNEAIANLNADVQRDNIQMHREGNTLQYQASMAHAAASAANAAANAGYKDAMLEQNMIQKNLMAQQRGETAFKDYLSTPEGKIQSTKAVSDPAAAKYLRDLRNWYMNDAYTGAGLKYNPGGQPSAKDQQGFKVLGVK
jgi:hypothetical protein